MAAAAGASSINPVASDRFSSCPTKEGSMIATAVRPCLLAIAVTALVTEAAGAQPGFEGAWIEEGQLCSAVFAAARDSTLGFKRPANAFAAAFVVRGRRLSTPLATCQIGRIEPAGERRVMHLACTTTIATDAARAVLSLGQDGSLYRHSAAEGGIATRYLRCTEKDLTNP